MSLPIANHLPGQIWFYGQINYLFSLYLVILLFGNCVVTYLLSICCAPWGFHFTFTSATCLHLFLIFLWLVKMNPLSCLLRIFPCICLSVFNSIFCITDHTIHIYYNHASKCPIFSRYAAEILSTHHRSLYLFHILKKHTRDKH